MVKKYSNSKKEKCVFSAKCHKIGKVAKPPLGAYMMENYMMSTGK